MPRYFTKRQRPVQNLEDFLTRVKKTESCWFWTGAKDDKGYGKLWENKKHHFAHRTSWMLHGGTIQQGEFICHHCDNPICVRPDHLFSGQPSDNTRDMFTKGRQNKASGDRHGSHTHPETVRRGSQINGSKLTADKVSFIKQMVGTQRSIATQFGVARETIRNIKLGRIWKHVV